MAILNSCCCWNNVRTGSIACGIYSLVYSLINGGIVGYNINFINHLHALTEGQNISTANIRVAEGWNYTTLAVTVLLFITSILLIVGIHKDTRYLLVPWLAAVTAVVGLDTAALIYECVTFGLLTFNIIQMVIWLGLTLLNIYCVLCVVSQYQELKAGRGRITDVRSRRSTHTVVYHPGVQQVHISQGPIVMTYNDRIVTPSGHTIPVIRPATKLVYNLPGYNIVTGYAAGNQSSISTDGACITTDGATVLTAATAEAGRDQNEALLAPEKEIPPPPYVP